MFSFSPIIEKLFRLKEYFLDFFLKRKFARQADHEQRRLRKLTVADKCVKRSSRTSLRMKNGGRGYPRY